LLSTLFYYKCSFNPYFTDNRSTLRTYNKPAQFFVQSYFTGTPLQHCQIGIYHISIWSFNPYFTGTTASTVENYNIRLAQNTCFNPYFTGTTASTFLPAISCVYLFFSFNPYFTGTTASTFLYR
jgi:hypothetical protein